MQHTICVAGTGALPDVRRVMAKGAFKTVGKGKRRFVPHPEPADDDELELEDDDAEEGGGGAAKAGGKNKRRRSLVDDAAEEDGEVRNQPLAAPFSRISSSRRLRSAVFVVHFDGEPHMVSLEPRL